MNTRKERCPDDHCPTIVLSGFARDALSFQPDEIVAGRYRITGTLARGGYSAVYAASHHSTRQPMAIKMLSIQHDVAAMRKVVRRFWREAQITARMTSPHTVRIIDVGQVDDGPLFIAMERLRGRTLGSFLQGLFKQDLVMSESEAIDVAIAVLRCLEEAHGLGLVHRDLKPNNIMLARVGADDTIVKVLDFGVARVKDSSLTADGNTLGTPAYMSPEQFRAARVDARSDLYSLGIILYLAVCGRLPFQEKNIHALGMQHLNEPVPDPRQHGRTELSSGFVDALMCVLRKAPENRYQSARTMRQALELVRGGAAKGMAVAHMQLRPVGRALIDHSVSARDSQAFLADAPEDATVGVDELEETIGIEEVDADAFAGALNPGLEAEAAAADDPDELPATRREDRLVESDPVTIPVRLRERVDLHAPTPGEPIETADLDNSGIDHPVVDDSICEDAAQQADAGATSPQGVRDTDPDSTEDVLDTLPSAAPDDNDGATLPLFDPTPSVGRMLMGDTTDRNFGKAADIFAAKGLTDPDDAEQDVSLNAEDTRPVAIDLEDRGTPTGVPTA